MISSRFSRLACCVLLTSSCGITISSPPVDVRDAAMEFDDREAGDISDVIPHDIDDVGDVDVPQRCEETPSEVMEASTWPPVAYARTHAGCLWRWNFTINTPDMPAVVSPPELVPALSSVRSIDFRSRLCVVAGGRALCPSRAGQPDIAEIPDAASVATAGNAMCAIVSDGRVMCSGTMLRRDAPDMPYYEVEHRSPAVVVGVSRATFVAAVPPLYFATTEGGRLWSWHGDLIAHENPGFTGATMIAKNGGHLLARLADGTVRCAGFNLLWECEASDRQISLEMPVEVAGARDIIQVAIGHSRASYALRADGRILRWGANRVNIAWLPAHALPQPELVADLADVVRITGGPGDLLAIRRDGTVWAFHLPTADGVPSLTRMVDFGPR